MIPYKEESFHLKRKTLLTSISHLQTHFKKVYPKLEDYIGTMDGKSVHLRKNP